NRLTVSLSYERARGAGSESCFVSEGVHKRFPLVPLSLLAATWLKLGHRRGCPGKLRDRLVRHDL
ncbi:MAG: hypothetical protein ABSD97_14760, partial [Acidimicrobiales bacterium]